MTQLVLTSKTSASVQKQLFDSTEAENQLLEAELDIKKNPEKYLSSAIGFVPDHLEYGCTEGVQIFKVSVPPLESFVAVRMQSTQVFKVLKQNDLLAKIGGQFLSLLAAVDLKQTGTVDRLYVSDQDHIWSVDAALTDYRLSYRLAEAKHASNLLVVPDVNGKGVRVYFLGQHAQKKGLFMIADSLMHDVVSEPMPIVEGDYRTFFVRFGRLILIPRDPNHKIEVLDLPSHQPVHVNLNVSCQLISLVDCIIEDKLEQRIAWRKIKK